MKKNLQILMMVPFLLLQTQPAAHAAQGTYFGNMGRDFIRGLKNVVSSPLEIPITMQEYHERAGRPVVRHIAGFFDGTVQCLERAGSGLWDFGAMFVPGDQEGVPPKPETLF